MDHADVQLQRTTILHMCQSRYQGELESSLAKLANRSTFSGKIGKSSNLVRFPGGFGSFKATTLLLGATYINRPLALILWGGSGNYANAHHSLLGFSTYMMSGIECFDHRKLARVKSSDISS